MLEQYKTRLDNLIGKVKLYNKNEILIKEFRNVNGVLVMKTDKRTFTFTENEIEPLLNHLEIEAPVVTPKVKSKRNYAGTQKDRYSKDGSHFIPSDSNIYIYI